jgi:hypothetical protein
VPASLIDVAQSWVAMRIRMGWGNGNEPGGGSGFPRFFYIECGSGSDNISSFYNEAGNDIYLSRVVGGVQTNLHTAKAVAAGDELLLIFAWTATDSYLSINGGAFASRASTPTTVAVTTIDIGSVKGTSAHIDGDVFWFASGLGVLSNEDVATLNAKGDTDPSPGDFPATALLTGLWHANDANFETSPDLLYPGRGSTLAAGGISAKTLTETPA